MFSDLGSWGVAFILCYITAATTEVTSNSAISTLLMPILSSLVNTIIFFLPILIDCDQLSTSKNYKVTMTFTDVQGHASTDDDVMLCFLQTNIHILNSIETTIFIFGLDLNIQQHKIHLG